PRSPRRSRRQRTAAWRSTTRHARLELRRAASHTIELPDGSLPVPLPLTADRSYLPLHGPGRSDLRRDPGRRAQTEVRASDYVQEGPLTTFFSSARRRSTIDSLSERVASFRTADIRRI